MLFFLIITAQVNTNDSIKIEEKWFTQDKLHHFFYSMSISTITYHIYHCRLNNPNPGAKYFSISIASVVGIGKEIYDKYYKKTKMSYKDFLADILGIVFSVFIFM